MKTNREILFRGWSEWEKKWYYGYLVKSEDNDCFIICNKHRIDITHTYEKEDDYHWWELYENYLNKVHPESVGQFTGRWDDEGEKEFKGDIVNFTCKCCLCLIVWQNPRLRFFPKLITKPSVHFTQENVLSYNFKIIGSAFRNPELLEGK